MKGRLKVILTLMLAFIATLSLGLCALITSANNVDLSAYNDLVFKSAYLGGHDLTQRCDDPNGDANASDRVFPGHITTWGGALALTFSTNVYNVGSPYEIANIQDQDSVIPGLKNKDLVVYTPRGSGITGISSIWFDTQSNLVIEPNDPYKASNISILKDEWSGLNYFDYRDGDVITIKKGFTFRGWDGEKQVVSVLKEDVVARFDEEEFTWNIISNNIGSTASATASDVAVTNTTLHDKTMAKIDLFKNGGRIPANTGTPANLSVKESAGTDLVGGFYGNADRMYLLNHPYVKYYDADGTEYGVSEIFYTTSGVVIKPNHTFSANVGDSILIKKGFREGYYYGLTKTDSYTGYDRVVGQDTYGVFQTVRTLGEDVAFRFNGTTWELIDTAPNYLDFSSAYNHGGNGRTLYWGQRIPLTFNVPVTEEVTYVLEDMDTTDNFAPEEIIKVSQDGVVSAVANDAVIYKWARVKAVFKSGKVVSIDIVNYGRGNINNANATLSHQNFGKIVLYRDYTGAIDVSDSAKNEIAGQIVLTGEMNNYGKATEIRLSGLDVTAVSATSVTVQYSNFSKSFPAQVFDMPVQKTLIEENVSSWNNKISVGLPQNTANTNHKEPFIDVEVMERMGQLDKVVLRSPKVVGKTYSADRIKYIYGYQVVPMYVGKTTDKLQKGDILEVKKGLKVYRLENDAPVAVAEIKNDLTLVYNGKTWQEIIVEAEDIQLGVTSVTLPVGAFFDVPYTVKPANAYAVAEITSSDSSKVEVVDNRYLSVKEQFSGVVNVTVALGNKVYTIAVSSKSVDSVVGYKIFTEDLYYSVSQGQDIDFSYYYNGYEKRQLQAVPVYSDGTSGYPFDLTTENCQISGYDKTVSGDQEITLTITHNGVTREIDDFVVTVYETLEQKVKLVLQDPYLKDTADPNYMATIFIDFSAFAGSVNVPKVITDGFNIANYIEFRRGGVNLGANVEINAEHLVVRPNLSGQANISFAKDDQVVLKEGLPLIAWTGTASNYATNGNGNWIKIGEVVCDTIIQCSNPLQPEPTWETVVEYSDLILSSESITLPISPTPQDAGAQMYPSYSTTGELFYESTDPTIVSVNANGQLIAKKVGETTVKITLKRMDKLSNIGDTTRQPIVKYLTVTVVDSPEGIKMETESIAVAVGTNLNGRTLVNKGVKASYIWKDGSVSGEVDFTNAIVDDSGFDKYEIGTYEVTVYVDYYGVYLFATLEVMVVEDESATEWPDDEPGCIGSITNGSFDLPLIIFATLTVVLGVVIIKKKAKRN